MSAMAPFKRAYLIEPALVTPTTDPTPLFTGKQILDAYWVLVQVRSMGTATYVRIGNRNAQESTFSGVGDYMIYDVPEGYVFNAAKMHVISDTSDAVLEISGMFPALSQDGADVE